MPKIKLRPAIGFGPIAALAAVSVAFAQPAAAPSGPKFIRGAVTSVAADQLVVKARDGKIFAITLAKGWTVQVTKAITAADIKPGSFIGTAEMPQANSTGRSLEVHVFPPGVKMGEGHYNWDLKQGSMMTNGTVGKVVAGAKGRELDVSYAAGERHITVPNNAPIVQIVPATRDLLKPGVKVFVVALPTPNGLVSNGVAIGENGKPPPM